MERKARIFSAEERRSLLDAYQDVFGVRPRSPLLGSHLAELNVEKVETAFRRRALELHPDRARVLGVPESALAHGFRTLTAARDLLRRAMEKEPQEDSSGADWTSGSERRAEPGEQGERADLPDGEPHGRAPSTSPSFYAGRAPQRRLLFAQFLYYEGWISWTEMALAVQWQRSQRPRFGELAVELGAMQSEDIAVVLRERRLREPFGAAALRVGILSDRQRRRTLHEQARLQIPIGQYFVQAGLLGRPRVRELVRKQGMHNRRAMDAR